MSESKANLLAANKLLEREVREARSALVALVADLNARADLPPEHWPSDTVPVPDWYWSTVL